MAPLNDGKRIGQVEDVVELGQAIEVRVDDIDPQGKVSLSLAGEYANADVSESPRPRPSRDGGDRGRDDRGPRESRGPRDDRGDRGSHDRPARDHAAPSGSSSAFEAAFEAELAGEIGDLGPGGPTFSADDGGGRRRPRPRRRSRPDCDARPPTFFVTLRP
jgi:polyribonucleotide nucleotidyltransferase